MKKYLIQIGIILFAAAALYVVYPKYYFSNKGLVRGNRITGKVEHYDKQLRVWLDSARPINAFGLQDDIGILRK